jgi:hypothetical protein
METIAVGPEAGPATEEPAPVVSRAVNARGRESAAARRRRVGLGVRVGLSVPMERNPDTAELLRWASKA